MDSVSAAPQKRITFGWLPGLEGPPPRAVRGVARTPRSQNCPKQGNLITKDEQSRTV